MPKESDDNVVMFGVPDAVRAALERVADATSRRSLLSLFRLRAAQVGEERAIDEVMRTAREIELVCRVGGDAGRAETRAQLAASVERFTRGGGIVARTYSTVQEWLAVPVPVTREVLITAACMLVWATWWWLLPAWRDAQAYRQIDTTPLAAIQAPISSKDVGVKGKVKDVIPGSLIVLDGNDEQDRERLILRWRTELFPLAAYYCISRPLTIDAVVPQLEDRWNSVFGGGPRLPIGTVKPAEYEPAPGMELRCTHIMRHQGFRLEPKPGWMPWWKYYWSKLTGAWIDVEHPL